MIVCTTVIELNSAMREAVYSYWYCTFAGLEKARNTKKAARLNTIT